MLCCSPVLIQHYGSIDVVLLVCKRYENAPQCFENTTSRYEVLLTRYKNLNQAL